MKRGEETCVVVGRSGTGKSLLLQAVGKTRGCRVVEACLAEPGEPGGPQRAAQALRLLLTAGAVLHVVDAARAGEPGGTGGTNGTEDEASDVALEAFARGRVRYVAVAAKMDRPWARSGLRSLRQALAGARVIPVSAREGWGLREVRAFLQEGR